MSEQVENTSVRPAMPLEMAAGSAKPANQEFAEPKKPQNLPTSASLGMENVKKSPNMIYLFVRGRFFRAYNGSAWLIHSLFRDTYKILRDKLLGKDSFVYLGFPKEMLSEIIGGKAEIAEQTDTYTCITVPEESLKAIPTYEKWLKTIPIKDKSENELPNHQAAFHAGLLQVTDIEDIITMLASYRIERHTLLENQIFLSDIIDRVVG